MLKPFDEKLFNALIQDEDDHGINCAFLNSFKIQFERGSISNGTHQLVALFFFAVFIVPEDAEYGPYGDYLDWKIPFRSPPFHHLCIKPDALHHGSIKIYHDDKHIKSFDISDDPKQWQELIRWTWNYGNDRLQAKAALKAAAAAKARRKLSTQSTRSLRSSSHLPIHNAKPNDRAQKDLLLHRISHSTSFKAHQSRKKGGGITKPSPLGMENSTLADIEEVVEDVQQKIPKESQVLREKDPNGTLKGVSPLKAVTDGTTGTSSDFGERMCQRRMENTTSEDAESMGEDVRNEIAEQRKRLCLLARAEQVL